MEPAPSGAGPLSPRSAFRVGVADGADGSKLLPGAVAGIKPMDGLPGPEGPEGPCAPGSKAPAVTITAPRFAKLRAVLVGVDGAEGKSAGAAAAPENYP
jgi:hypothetical protein